MVSKGQGESDGHQLAVRVGGGRSAREMVKDAMWTEETREERLTEAAGKKSCRQEMSKMVRDSHKPQLRVRDGQGKRANESLESSTADIDVKGGHSLKQQTEVVRERSYGQGC